MQRGDVSSELLLQDPFIWRIPHVAKSLQQGELRWDEYLRLMVNDLAFGMKPVEWIPVLLREGNVGLAEGLADHLRLRREYAKHIAADEQDWLQMVDVVKSEANDYMVEQTDEISSLDRFEYESLASTADQFLNERIYGDAVAALELALNTLRSSVERRVAAANAAFASAEKRVSEVRVLYGSIKRSKFPGGPAKCDIARQLLLRSDERLLARDYSAALEVANLVESLCHGTAVSDISVEKWLDPLLPSALPPAVEMSGIEEETSSEVEAIGELAFERTWTPNDDAYLIDNYDVLTNDQLIQRFHTSEREILRRIKYHGLVHERGTGKRVQWRNPYVAGKPIKSKQVFVGREDVFNFIADGLGSREEAEDRNLIVLLGHRRTGKTSILLQLRKNRRDILGARIPVFVDMEGLLPFPGGMLRNLFWKLACCIADELMDAEGIELPKPVEDEFRDPSWRFQDFLRQAQQAVSGRGLVLMLDEFHAIEPRRSSLDIDVYKMLRSVIQHSTSVDFILAGTMEMEALMRNYQAALFGSAISKRIDFLDVSDTRKLITRPVQSYVAFSPQAVERIVDVTASHPYFVQLVCWTLMQYLIERGKSAVFPEDVDHILPLTLERGVHFDEIWATDTTELERYVMAIIGEMVPDRAGWCNVVEIANRLRQEKQMPRDPNELDEAISNLTNRRILRRSDVGSTVRFQVNVFGSWVNTNKPLEVVKRDVRAEQAVQKRRSERQPMAG